MQKPPLDPDVADVAPSGPVLTSYDHQHLVTYLRLLDADAEGADWREVARIVLHLDPEFRSRSEDVRKPSRARQVDDGAWLPAIATPYHLTSAALDSRRRRCGVRCLHTVETPFISAFGPGPPVGVVAPRPAAFVLRVGLIVASIGSVAMTISIAPRFWNVMAIGPKQQLFSHFRKARAAILAIQSVE